MRQVLLVRLPNIFGRAVVEGVAAIDEDDPVEFLRKRARQLKPKGVFIVLDNGAEVVRVDTRVMVS